MAEALIGFLIAILIIGLIAGICVFIIRRAPFIPAEFKAIAEWIIIAVALIALLLKAMPLLGVSV